MSVGYGGQKGDKDGGAEEDKAVDDGEVVNENEFDSTRSTGPVRW